MFGKNKNNQEPDEEIFVIYDSKSESYGPCNFVKNKHVLIRDLLNLMNDPTQAKNKLLVNAEDYSVFKIGTYDLKTGTITTQQHEHVANMHDLRAMIQREKTVTPDQMGIVRT